MKECALIFRCDANGCDREIVQPARMRRTRGAMDRDELIAGLPDGWVEIEHEQFCDTCKTKITIQEIAGPQ